MRMTQRLLQLPTQRLPHLRRNITAGGAYFGGERASPAVLATFDAWHSAVGTVMAGTADTSDAMRRLHPHVDPQCVFRPPTYYKPWRGRDETLLLLGTVSEVFSTSFVYGRQWLSDDGREWALEFTADVADSGRTVHGIDLVSLCDQGRISEFTVLARPPNAVAALKVWPVLKLDPTGPQLTHSSPAASCGRPQAPAGQIT